MAFGKFRHSNIKGEKGSDWNIEIWKDGFSGSSTEFDMQGEGFEVTWNGEGSTRKRTFIASSCTINFFIQNANDETFAYDVLAAGFQTFYIRIYKGAITSDNANIWWYGWIQPSFDVLENVPFPYVYKLIATDSYGYFNKLKPLYFASQQGKLNDVASVFNSLFLPLLSNTSDSKLNIGGSTSNNLNPAPDNFKFFRTSANWWRSGDTFSTQTNPLNLYYVSPGAYAAKTEFDEDDLVTNQLDSLEYKLQDIFNGNLQLFNLVGFLAEGKYNFIQPNNLVNNTTGALNTFIQANLSSAQTLQNFTTDLAINQTDNVILGGSSIILDPPLESVKVKWQQAESSFNLDEGTNIEGQTINCGFLELNSGVYTFNYNTVNFTTVLKSAFIFDNDNHGVFSNTFTTTSVLTVKLTNGSDNYYLQETSEGLIWTLNNSNILSLNIKRGYNTEGLFGVINNSENIPYMNVANPTDFQPVLQILTQNYTGGGGGGDFPCKRLPDFGSGSSTKSKFRTNLSFNCEVQQPPISGSVSITVNTSIDYQERDINGGHIISDINDPTASTNVTEVLSGLSLTPSEANVQSGAGSGITFSASQTTTTALESLDLNDSTIGQSAVNTLYSVKYLDNPLYPPATSGFRRGNSGDYINILQLGVKEFLDLQTKPLEILQADIQSNNISPLKLIKYSINDDNNFKYYSFLGGTFKAQSEIMSGEWYKVENSTTIINDDPTTSAEFAFNPVANNSNQIASSLSNTNKIITTNLNVNILGVVDTALTSNVNVTLISLNANVAGKFYTNQKLFLALPDGTGQLEITCSTTKTSVSDIDVVSIAPKRDYPIGSIVLVKTADLTNVITGSGGGGTPGGPNTSVQYNNNGTFKGEAGFVYDEGNDRLTVPKVNTPILQSRSGSTTLHQIYTAGQNMAILSNTSVDVYLNAGNASAGTTAFQIKNPQTNAIVFAVNDQGVIKAIGNKITDSAGSDILDSSVSGNTKLKSVNDLELNIASAGATSRSLRFINNNTEVGSINSVGDMQIDGGLTTGGGTITIGGSNSNLELDSGSDIILEADQNGGGFDSTIQYPDSGGTNRILLGADNDVVILSNRAANGTVQIRANSSTAGGSGETTSATFEDDAITLAKATTFSAGIANSGLISAGTWRGSPITQAYINDQSINEAKLQVSNAPVNGYVLSAQSGNTGGLTWAAQSGGSSTTHRSIVNCGFNDASNTAGLFPFGSGGIFDRGASPLNQEYSVIVAPYDGYVEYVVLRCTGASGTIPITFHKQAAGTAGVPVTGNHSVNVSVSANTAVKANFGSTNGAFSAGDIIAAGYDTVNVALGDAIATMSIVYDLNNPL